MSVGSIGMPSALRQLRGLSGQQVYELWLDGGPSRWGSLSARNQARWESFALFLHNHAVIHIDPGPILEKAFGRRGLPIGGQNPLNADEELNDEELIRQGARRLSDEDIAQAAEQFLYGAVGTPDPAPVNPDERLIVSGPGMFNVDEQATKIAGQGHFLDGDTRYPQATAPEITTVLRALNELTEALKPLLADRV
jgi:hypothetical protein